MPFVPLPNGLLVECIHLLYGVPCECTFTLIKRPLVVEPTPQSAQLAVFQYWTQDILPLLSTDLLFSSMRMTDISVVGGQSLTVQLPTPIPGGVGGGSLTANVAVRVNLRVQTPPGGAKGCYFLPGIPKEVVDGNRPGAAWLASLDDVDGNLIDRAEQQSWRWVVASKWDNGQLRPLAVPWRVDFVKPESPWVGQRRRRLHNIVIP